MLLPAVQYGDWRTVKPRMRTLVTSLKRGAPVEEVMTREGMLDTGEYAGLLVLVPSGVTPRSAPAFYCAVPWAAVWEALLPLRKTPRRPSDLEEAIFEGLLRTPWGVLGLLGDSGTFWLHKPRHQRFLDAALVVWEELDSVGPRYYAAVQGTRLWSIPTTLHHVLANMGVPGEVLRSPLPPEGPRALLRHVKTRN